MVIVSELENHRTEIDRINAKIVELIAKRMEIAREIAKYKMKRGARVYDPKREEEIKGKLGTAAEKAGVNKDMVIRVFREIIRDTRREEFKLIEAANGGKKRKH